MSDNKKRKLFSEGAIEPAFISKSIAAHQTKTGIGAHSIFLGQVRRDQVDDSEVQSIEFSANQELAESTMAMIRESLFAKYDLTCMHIYHSLGKVNAGEICFFVFTSSAHRKNAMDACEELVERFKAEIPVWGREILSNGKSVWKKENHSKVKELT